MVKTPDLAGSLIATREVGLILLGAREVLRETLLTRHAGWSLLGDGAWDLTQLLHAHLHSIATCQATTTCPHDLLEGDFSRVRA